VVRGGIGQGYGGCRGKSRMIDGGKGETEFSREKRERYFSCE